MVFCLQQIIDGCKVRSMSIISCWLCIKNGTCSNYSHPLLICNCSSSVSCSEWGSAALSPWWGKNLYRCSYNMKMDDITSHRSKDNSLWSRPGGLLQYKAVFRDDLRVKSGVYPESAFHTCTTQWEVLCTDVFSTATNPPHYSGKRWSSQVQQAEAGSNVLAKLQRSHGFLYKAHDTMISSHRHKRSLLSLCIFYVCVTTFSLGGFCLVFDIFTFFLWK